MPGEVASGQTEGLACQLMCGPSCVKVTTWKPGDTAGQAASEALVGQVCLAEGGWPGTRPSPALKSDITVSEFSVLPALSP